MYNDDDVNWDLVQKNMEDDAEEVYERYKKEFPTDDYKKIAEMLAKAYIFAKVTNKSCEAYEDWSMPDNYAYAVLGMIDKYFHYECESERDDYLCDSRDDEPCYMEW